MASKRLGAARERRPFDPAEPEALPQGHAVAFFVPFAVWLASIPSHQFYLFGTYGTHKLLFPVLCLAALFSPRLQNAAVAARRRRTLAAMLGLYLSYAAFRVLAVGDAELSWDEAFFVFRQGCYFLLPAVFIRDLWSFRMTPSLLIVVTALAAVSAFLASTDLVRLDTERFEASRLGIDWLDKATGLLASYGDVAMLYAFTCVALLGRPRAHLMLGVGTRPGRRLVWIALLLGLIGSQSRNMLLASLLGACGYWVYRGSKGRGGARDSPCLEGRW